MKLTLFSIFLLTGVSAHAGKCPWLVENLTTSQERSHYELEGGAVVTVNGAIRVIDPAFTESQTNSRVFFDTPFKRTNRGLYDGGGEPSISELYPPAMLPTAETVKGVSVLDAGCGDGLFVYDLIQMGAVAKGVDAYLNPLQHQFSQIFKQRNLRATGYQDGEFKKIWYTWGPSVWNYKNEGLNIAIFRELARILDRDGSIYSASYHKTLESLTRVIGATQSLSIRSIVDIPGKQPSIAVELIRNK